MARKNLKPVSVDGIEFDALIEEQKTLSATVPVYPVEDGYPVSDTIILDPITLQMTLYVSNTPVTWLYRHGSSNTRVQSVCNEIEKLYEEKKLVKIVTPEAIYTNMGVTSISMKRSREIGYAVEIGLTAQKVRVTERQVTTVPAYDLKGGDTQADAGMAATSSTSAKESGASESSSTSQSNAEKSRSILYGVASGLDFIN